MLLLLVELGLGAQGQAREEQPRVSCSQPSSTEGGRMAAGRLGQASSYGMTAAPVLARGSGLMRRAGGKSSSHTAAVGGSSVLPGPRPRL